MTSATESEVLGVLFREARTFSYWQQRPVSEALVETAFELACLGPTSGNCQPWRLVLVRSPAAKQRLLPCVSSGNYEKVRTAPITAIVAYDREFFELLPRLHPHTDARGLVHEQCRPRRGDRSAQFVIAGRLFHIGVTCSYWRYVPRGSIVDRCRGSTPTRSTRRSFPIADTARTFC